MMSSKQQETRPEQQDAEPESSALADAAASQSKHASDPDNSIPHEAHDAADQGSADEGGLEAHVQALEAELGSLKEELSSVNDKYLRKLADDANFRKRMSREKEEGQRYAVATLLGDLIPVLDDFDRAIASAELQKDYGVLHDGVTLIRRQLGSVLESKYGLARYESEGKPFDPNRHEAVAMVQAGPEGGDEAIVAEEFLPGYGLHDRILRTAKVRVRMPGPKAESQPNAASPAAENSVS
jgi:molecular chaperone GrpE